MANDQLRAGPSGASHRLVLLHGWGADADDLMELGELLADGDTEWVALQAPEPHPMGTGRQWYDLQQPGWPGLAAARTDLKARLIALGDTLPMERTSLLGFSQGAAMALDVASGLPIAGLIACSGYPHPGWQPEAPLTRVLLTHGRADQVVPYAASEELARQLAAASGAVDLHGFNGGHTIDPALFPLLKGFLRQNRSAAPLQE